ncbi:MAG: endonuclease III [Dehalococcoidia bacterium]|nr:endonuclease III [Dehalococcoidia bacterium]
MPIHTPHGDAVAELVLTILSQNTADTNSGRAFVQLMRRYPSWQAVAEAPLDELVATIQNGGLAQQKAPRIQAALRAVQERSPTWDLEFLRALDLEAARAWLRALPGVGPKTTACVLLFALGLPAMPVDTHVERVAKRLALIPATLTPEQAHDALEALVPPGDYYRFHMLLIKHGRRLCAARRPLCERCPLAPDCPASLLNPAPAAAQSSSKSSQSSKSSRTERERPPITGASTKASSSRGASRSASTRRPSSASTIADPASTRPKNDTTT